MYITSKEAEAWIGQELAVRLCAWVWSHTPVTCIEETGREHVVVFNIDEAIEFSKIKMNLDEAKREFFPHFVKLKQCKVAAV